MNGEGEGGGAATPNTTPNSLSSIKSACYLFLLTFLCMFLCLSCRLLSIAVAGCPTLIITPSFTCHTFHLGISCFTLLSPAYLCFLLLLPASLIHLFCTLLPIAYHSLLVPCCPLPFPATVFSLSLFLLQLLSFSTPSYLVFSPDAFSV